MPASPSPPHRRLAAVVPSVAGWQSYRGVWTNLLLLGLASLAGTWAVHQAEYALEYGRRFSTVMATSPHRFYMAPAGVALGTTLGGFLVFGGLVLGLYHRNVARIVPRLPRRQVRHIRLGPSVVAMEAIVRTSLVLGFVQSVLYLLQENLEYLAGTGTMPGFAVLLAPPHATVLPLQFLAAACLSLVLWTLSAWLARSRRTLAVARLLLELLTRGEDTPLPRFAPREYLPNLRMTSGVFSLRSPPAAA